MAATWAVALCTLATTTLVGGLIIGVIPSGIFGPREVVAVALRTLIAGAVAGTVFSALFSGAERRKTLASLSTRRVAVWGFLGATLIPLVSVAVLGTAGVLPAAVIAGGSIMFGALGSAMAVATVRIARNAPAPSLPAIGSTDERTIAPQ